jgi:hypothetical protein
VQTPLRRELLSILTCAAGALLLFSACDNRDDAPADCVTHKPDLGTLTVKLTINDANPRVPLALYRGDFEEGDLVLRDTLSTAIAVYDLPVDQYYSVTARYITGRDTTLAIDGASIDTESTEYRNATCWDVTDAEVDIRLVH